MAISSTTASLHSNGNIEIITNGLPDPALYGDPLGSGLFPDNPNTITPHTQTFEFFYRGGEAKDLPNPQQTTLGPQGIALNGVVLFNPSAAPGPLPGTTTQPPVGFSYNAVYNEDAYGVDACGGHPEEDGNYHYHSAAFLVNCWGSKVISSNSYFSSSSYNGDYFRHPDGHSKIVGICFDGYPIYGPFGYTNPNDQLSEPIRMRSSYRAYPSPRVGRGSTYAQIPPGVYVQDFEYVENLGTLDEFNGRYSVTPDYPSGTYAYYLTVDSENRPVYPYIFGNSTRKPRASFEHAH